MYRQLQIFHMHKQYYLSINFIRFQRIIHNKGENREFRDSLNLPKTNFPLSMKNGATPKREITIRKETEFDNLYVWQKHQSRRKIFCLHDGPPYANGDVHVGHALNKVILKDFVNRLKLLQGFQINYKPGWDCHGTPIEQKAFTTIKKNYNELLPIEIRKTAKLFAQSTINKHKIAFQRWGIMGDWKNDCYYTFDKEYEAKQLELFYDLFQKKLIYEDFMPVYWSPSSKSALAESELEYNENHISKSIFVQFSMDIIPDKLKPFINNNENVYLIIWTTTPWTIPANQAICFGNNINYCLIKDSKTGKLYIAGENSYKKIQTLFASNLSVVTTFSGFILQNSTYSNPFSSTKKPLLPSNHVVVTKGTGLVHTAPAHGIDDFHLAAPHNLIVESIVDEYGNFTKEAGIDLVGKSVITDGNVKVLELMHKDIIAQEDYVHSYPYDWRTKKPVILRASRQWFINTGKIKHNAMEALNYVKIMPSNTEKAMHLTLESRPYWCISRQRSWGLPIPVFYEKKTRKPLITNDSVNHVINLVRCHGSDCWWEMDETVLLPDNIKIQAGFKKDDVFEKGSDIMDIWLDSGSSWFAVLDDTKIADIYLEGLDQFGGWFQSSLLTSVAVRNIAPYKNILVHGFVVDENGKKMSKSIGNIIDPQKIVDGIPKNDDDVAGYGADILRWWASLSYDDPKVSIGQSILKKNHEQMFKIRKTLRFLLGNLSDFSISNKITIKEMLPQDKYMMHLLANFVDDSRKFYECYEFKKVVLNLEKFINTHVSAFYCHIIKDRLYCNISNSFERQSCQVVLYHILNEIVQILAPITPFISEEICLYYPLSENGSVFKQIWASNEIYSDWKNDNLAEQFSCVFQIRDAFYSFIGSEEPLEFDVVLCLKETVYNAIKTLQSIEYRSSTSPLCEIFQSSNVTVMQNAPTVIPEDANAVEGVCRLLSNSNKAFDENFLLLILSAQDEMCCRCRRYTVISTIDNNKDGLCERCKKCLNSF